MAITEMPTWTLGDKLRKTRDRAGLSLIEMAELISATGPRKVSRQLLGAWESDEAFPRYQEVECWATITKTPVLWFSESGSGYMPTLTGVDSPTGQMEFAFTEPPSLASAV